MPRPAEMADGATIVLTDVLAADATSALIEAPVSLPEPGGDDGC
jgi:hypothetical protein